MVALFDSSLESKLVSLAGWILAEVPDWAVRAGHSGWQHRQVAISGGQGIRGRSNPVPRSGPRRSNWGRSAPIPFQPAPSPRFGVAGSEKVGTPRVRPSARQREVRSSVCQSRSGEGGADWNRIRTQLYVRLEFGCPCSVGPVFVTPSNQPLTQCVLGRPHPGSLGVQRQPR